MDMENRFTKTKIVTKESTSWENSTVKALTDGPTMLFTRDSSKTDYDMEKVYGDRIEREEGMFIREIISKTRSQGTGSTHGRMDRFSRAISLMI